MSIGNFYKISKKEIRQNFNNYWFFLSASVFCFLNFVIVYFSESISGDYSQTDVRSLSLSIIHLQMYLVPLFAFILSYDSILSERESGMLDLILSYRITFFDVLMGKLIGNSILFSLSFILGFLPVFIYLVFLGVSFFSLFKFVCVSIWLIFIFNSIALYVSMSSKDRTVVILVSIFIWLFFVFVYDIFYVVLAILFDTKSFSDNLSFVLFLNPAEIFRLSSIFYFMPSDANDLFGINVGVLNLLYVYVSMILWVIFSICGFYFIYIRNRW
ncbi:MAG TPA: ABC transporter permease subunit [Candidatus Azoamicus sp. OHIO1]